MDGFLIDFFDGFRDFRFAMYDSLFQLAAIAALGGIAKRRLESIAAEIERTKVTLRALIVVSACHLAATLTLVGVYLWRSA